MGCVYLAVNTINGKKYVGKTTASLSSRRASHERAARSGSKRYFHNALRKYGASAFEWHVLFTHEDEDVLFDEELWHIALLKSKAPGGYNLSDGGEGQLGYAHTQETRSRISSSSKGKSRTSITRSRISEGAKRRAWSDEGRSHMLLLALSKVGVKRSESTRSKISISQKGRNLPADVRQKISEALKGRKKSATHIAKVTASLKGRRFSELHLANLREAHKRRRASCLP